MAQPHADHSLWMTEQQTLAPLRLENPDAFIPPVHPPETLRWQIGITAPAPSLPDGYIKYSALDFIVEEVRQNGKPVLADVSDQPSSHTPSGKALFADLIKVGISTIDAVERLAHALEIVPKRIGYAGIKDAAAVTAQRISFENPKNRSLAELAVPNVALRHVGTGDGAIRVGQLQGNRFTLFIRTNGTDETFGARLERVAKDGAINYYGTQRFGSPRFLAHVFGMHLVRGDARAAVQAYLTQPCAFEAPYYANLRAEAAKHFGDWNAMLEIFQPLPYAFRHEHTMLRTLLATPRDDGYRAAIEAVGSQAKLWCMAYASYLANIVLSEGETGARELPSSIPLLMSQDPAAGIFYEPWLQQHGTRDYQAALKPYAFITLGSSAQTLQTRIRPTVHGHKVLPHGAAVSFDLPKGAYATTILANLFNVQIGKPVPEWLVKDEVDSKAVLGTGSMESIKRVFAKSLAEMAGAASEEEV